MKQVVFSLCILFAVNMCMGTSAVVFVNSGRLVLHPQAFCIYSDEGALLYVNNDMGVVARSLLKQRVDGHVFDVLGQIIHGRCAHDGKEIMARMYMENGDISIGYISYDAFVDFVSKSGVENSASSEWVNNVKKRNEPTGQP